MTALYHSSGTSSGWLKAIPSTSLGLAIPGPEFIVGLRLWLGVSLFPISPLCTCLSSIDCFGEDLLGCSHGPMRIRRHDALVNILHHALLQDHPGVLTEQSASFDDSSRPGDILYPDYQLGRSAYFDVSVLQQNILSGCINGQAGPHMFDINGPAGPPMTAKMVLPEQNWSRL